MGTQRLRAGVRRVPAAGRAAGRPAGPAPDPDHRGSSVHRRLARLRAGRLGGRAGRRPRGGGAGRCADGSGGAIGVLAGGMLTTWLSWPWNFFVNLPVGVLIVAAARTLLPESRADLRHRRFDVVGAVTVTA